MIALNYGQDKLSFSKTQEKILIIEMLLLEAIKSGDLSHVKRALHLLQEIKNHICREVKFMI